MEHLLALDINDAYVSGVLLEFGQKAIVVRNYSVAPLGKRALVDAVRDVLTQTGYTRGECRVNLSSDTCFFRNLTLPFRDNRKIARVLPFELEELTSFTPEEWLLDYTILPGENGEADLFTGMVKKHTLLDVLSQLQEAGVDPEVVTVSGMSTAIALATINAANSNCILLDIGLKRTTLVIADQGRIALIRSINLDTEAIAGCTFSDESKKVIILKPEALAEIADRILQPLRQTLLSVGKGEMLEDGAICFIDGAVGLEAAMYEQLRRKISMEVTPCNISKRHLLKVEPVEGCSWVPPLMNTPLALALYQKGDGAIFNFRRDEFKKKRSLVEVKKRAVAAGVCLAVACFAVVGYLAWDYSKLVERRDALDKEIHSLFKTTLPEVSRVVDPVQQLKVKVDEGRRVYGDGQGTSSINKLMILAELSARIPDTLPVRITRLVNDQNDLRIMAETSDFNTVDNVKRELEKSSMFGSVVISSANLAPRGGGVRFELKVQFR